MSRRVRVHEVLEFLGVEESDLLDALRREGLFEAEELEPAEADELRVATVLIQELGVNAAGVDVILRLRRRLFSLETLTRDALERVRRGDGGPGSRR